MLSPEAIPEEGDMKTTKRVWMAVLTWVVMAFSSTVWAQPNLQIGSGSGVPGGAVSVPVTFTNSGSVAALQFDLQYNSANLTAGSLTSGAALSPHVLYSSAPSSGALRVVIIPPVVSPLPATNTGILVNIPLTISASANPGNYPLAISNPSVVFSDGSAHLVGPGTLSNGQVTVQATVGSPEMVVDRLLLQEDFASGISESWFVAGVWGGGCEGGSPIEDPFDAPWAIVDSNCAVAPDERLYAPIFDASSCSTVTLRFSSQFDHGVDATASIAVTDDYGEIWTPVMTMTGNAGPETKEIDISVLAGQDKGLIGFSYASPDGALGNGFWAIDNVQVLCQLSGLQSKAPINLASSPQTLMIRNKGNLDLDIDHINLSGDTGFSLQNDHCTGQSLAPEGKCTVDVVFTPVDAATRTVTLSFSSNDPGAPNLTLSGKGAQFLVEPEEGWTGTEITLTGSGFGAKKGSVLLGTNALKVLDWQTDVIHALLSKTIPTETYDVTVKPKEPKGALPLVEERAFMVITTEPPRIFRVSPDQGVVGTEVTANGLFFGSKGSLYLDYVGSKGPMRKKCKVLKWAMDPETGDSEIVFVVPLITAGATDVVVVPKAPVTEAKQENGFTMMAPEITSVNPGSGSVGQSIEIRGHYFGAKKGKVYLGGYEVKGKPAQKNCAVTGWVVNPTGEDVITFIVPGGMAAGSYDLIITNSVGSDTEPHSFTIE
jgi:hypothetical protein